MTSWIKTVFMLSSYDVGYILYTSSTIQALGVLFSTNKAIYYMTYYRLLPDELDPFD